MKSYIGLGHIFAALILAIGFFSCNYGNDSLSEKELAAQKKLIKRGKYLVGIMGCNDCHSPKVMTATGPIPNPQKLLSGHPQEAVVQPYDTSMVYDWILFNHHNTAIVGPWGVSFSANISSDATGIGNWTLEQFGRALKEGKYKGLENGRMLLPPMPWQNYTNISDNDLKAIFTYLKSTKPVRNNVPDPIIAEPETF